jgi:Carboxypeptidase regulatory-like domain
MPDLGTVTDTTGASVPGAKVVIVNIENNQSNELLVDQGGRYELPLLKPGAYRMTASAKEAP